MSGSDPSEKCQDFVRTNYPSRFPKHWFNSMQDQTDGKACKMHPYAHSCASASAEPAIAFLGTPCHPYSTQRSDRYSQGSVANHREFTTGMQDTIEFLKAFKPKICISEQVQGFNKPFAAGTTETPLRMLLDWL